MKKLDEKTRENVSRNAMYVYQYIQTIDGNVDMEDIDFLVAVAYQFGQIQAGEKLTSMIERTDKGLWFEEIERLRKEIEGI